MARKYKVYLNSHSIILLFSKEYYQQKESCDWSIKNPSTKEINEKIQALFHEEEKKKICFHSDNLEELWQHFQSIFTVIHAGGGLVSNADHAYLFIYRNEKWDLPKGKLDPGETIEQCAVREVEEECGIHQLTLGEKIKNTYHIYEFKGKTVLKITHWYKMNYQGNEKLIPQVEEGITKVAWIPVQDFDRVKKNTYANILEVLEMVGK